MKVVKAALCGAVFVGLVGCSGASVVPKPVYGDRSDIRYLEKQTEQVKEKQYKNECTKRNTNGTCKTWKKTYTGTKVVTKVLRNETWCVQLDNLNGKRRKDNRWFTVTSTVYLKAAGMVEGKRISFTPIHSGCS